jgi:hypothetical protein
MASSPQFETALLKAIRQVIDDGNDISKGIKVQDDGLAKSLKLWKGIAAVILAAGSIAAWYRGYISDDVRAEIAEETKATARVQFVDEKIGEVNARVDGVADDFDTFVKEQKIENTATRIRTQRTEKMIENLSRRRGVKVPPKSAAQIEAESKLGIAR